jgi:hypothetical protein
MYDRPRKIRGLVSVFDRDPVEVDLLKSNQFKRDYPSIGSNLYNKEHGKNKTIIKLIFRQESNQLHLLSSTWTWSSDYGFLHTIQSSYSRRKELFS